MFRFCARNIKQYITFLHTYSVFGYIHIAALAVLDNGVIVVTSNTRTQHAEQIILNMYSNIQAIFVSHEPCIACGFNILYNSIPYLFFSNYNPAYGCTQLALPYSGNTNVFGGLYPADTLQRFFHTKR